MGETLCACITSIVLHKKKIKKDLKSAHIIALYSHCDARRLQKDMTVALRTIFTSLADDLSHIAPFEVASCLLQAARIIF